jgi:hypothetical protein
VRHNQVGNGSLAEQDDEWTESRRYMDLKILAAWRKAGQMSTAAEFSRR